MRRFLLITLLAVVATPASALAAPVHGVLLSVNRAHHYVQVVDSSHRVHVYRYRGRARLRPGIRLSFRVHGARITRLERVAGGVRTVSFYGRVVVSSSRGVVLRLADGKRLRFAAGQITHAAPPKPVRHRRVLAHMASDSPTHAALAVPVLQPGVTVLVHERVNGTLMRVDLTVPPAPVAR